MTGSTKSNEARPVTAFSTRCRVAILGGGQLAKMLYEAAIPMGLRPTVYVESAEDPAARVCPRVVTGKLDDPRRLDVLFSVTDHIVFENEFVDCALLAKVAASHPGVRFHPELETLSRLRDKAVQKETLEELAIPTAPYRLLPDGRPIPEWLGEVRAAFPRGFVLKWGQMGYDGKGVSFAEDVASQEKFCALAREKGVSCYAEEKVAFRRELALVACRGKDGAFVSYPLVISEQERGICVRVVGPACALGVSEALEKKAAESAAKLAHAVGVVGCFAIEFFETEGGLLVNEIAPRVHNSGHYTQDAAVTSQYENHWRAVLGLPLGSAQTTPVFAMANLLGPAGLTADGRDIPLPVPPPGVHVHWYGKVDIRPGRKIGHLNAAGRSPAELDALVTAMRECEARWVETLVKR